MSDQTIKSLIEKLEGAEVGSRELDREIMALSYRYEQRYIGASCWDDEDDTCCPGAKHLDWVWVDPTTDQWKTNARDGFEFTTSLDAALALAERVVGGKEALLLLTGLLTLEADASDFDSITVSDLPRLFCAALLRATGEDSPANEGEGAS